MNLPNSEEVNTINTADETHSLGSHELDDVGNAATSSGAPITSKEVAVVDKVKKSLALLKVPQVRVATDLTTVVGYPKLNRKILVYSFITALYVTLHNWIFFIEINNY